MNDFYDRSVIGSDKCFSKEFLYPIQYCKWGETLGIGVGHLAPEDRADVSQDMFERSNILDNPNVDMSTIRASSGFFAMANWNEKEIIENNYTNLTILMVEQYNKDQWGFPMGGIEQGDKNLIETAIREWNEETGRQLPLESFLCSYSKEYSDAILTEPFLRFRNQVSKPYQAVSLGKSIEDNLYRWTYYRNTVAGPVKTKCVNLIPMITPYPSEMFFNMEPILNPSTHSPEILQSAWVPYEEVLDRVCDADRVVLRHGLNDLAYGLKVASQGVRNYLEPFQKRPDQTTTTGRIQNMFKKFGLAPDPSNLEALADKIYEADQKSENDRIEECLNAEEES